MDLVIEIIGIVFVFIAIGYLIKSAVLKIWMEFFKEGKRMYFAMYLFAGLIRLAQAIVLLLAYLFSALNGLNLISGLIRLALGVVFLLGARECKQFWLIFVLGILLLISGILVLVLGPKKLRPMIEWFQKQSEILQRVIALIVLAVGVVIIISA